jgi:uncharacterized DUF497 family protein
MHKKILQLLLSFEWDSSNQHKSWKKHGITQQEAEQVFMCDHILVYYDEKHSDVEARYYLLGETQESKKLFVVFTVRINKVRIVSARAMSRGERKIYEKQETDS